jgi:hypothetical protein
LGFDLVALRALLAPDAPFHRFGLTCPDTPFLLEGMQDGALGTFGISIAECSAWYKNHLVIVNGLDFGPS